MRDVFWTMTSNPNPSYAVSTLCPQYRSFLVFDWFNFKQNRLLCLYQWDISGKLDLQAANIVVCMHELVFATNLGLDDKEVEQGTLHIFLNNKRSYSQCTLKKPHGIWAFHFYVLFTWIALLCLHLSLFFVCKVMPPLFFWLDEFFWVWVWSSSWLVSISGLKFPC